MIMITMIIKPETPTDMEGKNIKSLIFSWYEYGISVYPQILARLVNFVCSVAASDTWRPLLQEDTSLLITSVCK